MQNCESFNRPLSENWHIACLTHLPREIRDLELWENLAGEESQPLGLATVRFITTYARRDERREWQDKGVNGSLAESSKRGEEKGV